MRHYLVLGVALVGCSDGSPTTGRTAANAAMTRWTGDEIRSVAAVGDLDGDGIDDAIITSQPGPHGTDHATVYSYIAYGGAAAPEVDLATLPALASDAMVIAATPVGDVDGDGLADVLLDVSSELACVTGAPEAQRHGGAILVYGSRARLAGVVSSVDAGAFLRDPMPCTTTGAESVALGDLDHDGKADFAVTSRPTSDLAGAEPSDARPIFVYYGSAVRRAGTLDVTASADARISGTAMQAFRGGDLDGDGFGDFFVIVNGYDEAVHLNTDRIALVRGAATRLAGDVDLASITAATFVTAHANATGGFALGDLDGDGRDDVVFNFGPQNGAETNHALLFYGRAGGFSGEIDLATADARATSEQIFGVMTFAAADIDGDGTRDLVVADPSAGGFDGGIHLVTHLSGRLSGELDFTTLGETLRGTEVQLDCDAGPAACPMQQMLGAAMGLGDLDGDGLPDAVVAAPTLNPNTGMSRAYLLDLRHHGQLTR